MLKIEDLRKKTKNELLIQISELKGKLLALRFENATGQLKETHLLKFTKQDIAKVFTVIKELEDETILKQKKVVKESKTIRKVFPTKGKISSEEIVAEKPLKNTKPTTEDSLKDEPKTTITTTKKITKKETTPKKTKEEIK